MSLSLVKNNPSPGKIARAYASLLSRHLLEAYTSEIAFLELTEMVSGPYIKLSKGTPIER
jgi:hypothetical protein